MNGLTAHKCHLYREWTRQGWYQLLWNTTGLHKLLGFTWQKAPFFISIKKNSFVQVRHVFPSKTAVSDPVFMNHLFHRWKVWATLSSLFRSSHHSLPDLCPNPPPPNSTSLPLPPHYKAGHNSVTQAREVNPVQLLVSTLGPSLRSAWHLFQRLKGCWETEGLQEGGAGETLESCPFF